MKKILAITLIIIMGLFALCSCGAEKVVEQTGKLSYEVETGWTSRTVTPAPSTLKVYNYPEHTVLVGNLSYVFYEDPLMEAIQYAVGDTYGMGTSFDSYDCTVNDMAAQEAVVDTGNLQGIFTSIETPQGIYVIATTAENSELDIKGMHDSLKETVAFSDANDGEVYAKNILQFGNYICQLPGWSSEIIDTPWWTSRTVENNGVINYAFGNDSTSLMIAPMEGTELTEELIHTALGYIYDGSAAPEATATLSGRTEMKCGIGSAVYYVLDLHFGEDKSNTVKSSAVFVLDEEGQAVCCITNTADSDLTYDYSVILKSMQPADPVDEAVDIIYSLAADYTGDNSAVMNLLNAIGFGEYGEYTMELKTDTEPYGVIVKYKGQVAQNDVLLADGTQISTATEPADDAAVPYDFQRECVMMLGLVGNLDYIEIKDVDSNIVRYDTSVTKSLLMYDVKQMAEDKAVLESYYLETLY